MLELVYYALMQIIINISKYFLFAVLSLSLLITWDVNNLQAAGISLDLPTTELNIFARPEAASDASIWTTMSREFSLNHHAESPQVRAEIRKLLADHDRLNHILRAATPYIYFIHKETVKRGLPAELALIPVIESEFNPNDHSSAGATGLWQLMPATARELGVKVKSNYDGRRNVVASTKAALAYFRDLGHLFNGNWLLAIAAYNCGQVKVAHAAKIAGTHNFWNLHLPRETTYYVPRLLAVAAIVENPKKYGVELPVVQNKQFFKEVTITKNVKLSQVAKSSGSPLKTLNALNPEYKHDVVEPPKGVNTMLVPITQTV